MTIRLKGELDYAFGNFPCLRGFATLGDLSDYSVPDGNYQRQLEESHLEEIRKFLGNKEYTFFPEVVLGTSLEQLGFSYELQERFHAILKDQTGLPPKRLTSMLAIQIGRKLSNQTARSVTLIISSEEPCFARIDGNHRLEAVPPHQGDGLGVRTRIAPFCLIIFNTRERYERFAPYFFHTINYRSSPIPKEKNLEIILRSRKRNGEYIFGDLMLQNDSSFGAQYYYARKLDECINIEDTPYLKKVSQNRWLTFILDICEYLIQRNFIDADANVNSLCRKIQRGFIKVDESLSEINSTDRFSFKLLIPMVYYSINGLYTEFDGFVTWIRENNLISLSDADMEEIKTIFEKVHSRGPYKVFVAMPYISPKRVNDFNKLFSEALAELSKNSSNGIRYDLIPIMRFRGASQRIDQLLIKCIKECDVFVADITGNNENVIFEVGLAEGAGKPLFLIREDKDDKADKIFVHDEEYVRSGGQVAFDMDKLQYIPYSATGYYNDIKGIVKRHLPVIVEELRKQEIMADVLKGSAL